MRIRSILRRSHRYLRFTTITISTVFNVPTFFVLIVVFTIIIIVLAVLEPVIQDLSPWLFQRIHIGCRKRRLVFNTGVSSPLYSCLGFRYLPGDREMLYCHNCPSFPGLSPFFPISKRTPRLHPIRSRRPNMRDRPVANKESYSREG